MQHRKYVLIYLVILTAVIVGCSEELLPTSVDSSSDFGDNLRWLKGQMVPNEIVPQPIPSREGLIISYRIPPTDDAYPYLFARSWIYDDALAVVGFTMADERSDARTILAALSAQMEADGKLGFSYNTHDHWYHQYYRSGGIAWVGYATCFYQSQTGDPTFQPMAESIAAYLMTLQDRDTTSPSYGSVKGGPDVSWYSTEHNIACYFLFRDLAETTNNAAYMDASNLVRGSLLDHHWNEDKGIFDQGISDPTHVLDCSSLGSMFLLSIGESERAQRCLHFAEDVFFTHDLVDGYAPYEGKSLVWTEGTLQMATAYAKIGGTAKAKDIVKQITSLQDANGGIPYSSSTDLQLEFHDWPSVAGTAWLIIAVQFSQPFLGS